MPSKRFSANHDPFMIWFELSFYVGVEKFGMFGSWLGISSILLSWIGRFWAQYGVVSGFCLKPNVYCLDEGPQEDRRSWRGDAAQRWESSAIDWFAEKIINASFVLMCIVLLLASFGWWLSKVANAIQVFDLFARERRCEAGLSGSVLCSKPYHCQ